MNESAWKKVGGAITVGTVVENLLVCGVPSLSHRSTLHTIDSFQSCDQLEDLEGKTSIELLHKRVNFSSGSQIWPFAIHIKHPQQYFNHKQFNKTL